MNEHILVARINRYIIALFCVIAFGAMAAHLDKQREADDKAVRAHVERQAKAQGERK
jgi:hypothetical protein